MSPNSLLFSHRESRPSLVMRGVIGSAIVLGNLLVTGPPINLDNNRARAYCACSRYGWGLFG